MIKFGILSTANIGITMTEHIRLIPDEVQVVAVASRTLDRAQQFASLHNIPKAYGSYEELIEDSEINAVYIPLPTTMKTEWAIAAANAGKHILCDKPILSHLDVESILEACHRNNVHFMDNTMFLHSDRNLTMLQNEQNTVFGKNLKRVHNSLSWNCDDENNIRLHKDLEPQGAIGDLGWYNIRNILWAFNYEKPTRVQAHGLLSKSDVPLRCDGWVWFENPDRIASFNCSLAECGRQFSEYVSRDYTIEQRTLGDEPAEYLLFKSGNAVAQVIPTKTNEPSIIHLLRRFALDVQNPSSEQARKWGQETLLTMKVLDAVDKSSRDPNHPVINID
jgi:predicted dehydrogenase